MCNNCTCDPTPLATEIHTASGAPAQNNEDLELIGHGLIANIVRLIVSLLTASTKFRDILVTSVVQHSIFTTHVVDSARAGLADDLKAPRTVVQSVNFANIEPVYGRVRVLAGVSRLAIVVGAIIGFVAGVVAMMMIDATPVTVDLADQSASVGVSQAVDAWWFIVIVVALSTLAGAVIGSLRQKVEHMSVVTGFKVTDSSN